MEIAALDKMAAMTTMMLKQVQQLSEINEMITEAALSMSLASAPHLGNIVDIQA